MKKIRISPYLKELQKEYGYRITLETIAKDTELTRETLSRMTTASPYKNVIKVCKSIYKWYPQISDHYNTDTIIEKMTDNERQGGG